MRDGHRMLCDTFAELFSASESLNAAIKMLSRIPQNGVRRMLLSFKSRMVLSV